MLLITIELLPFGLESNKKEIGKLQIWNDNTGTNEKGNYKYALYGENNFLRRGEVKKFPRLKKGAWHLIRTILNEAYCQKQKEIE